MPMQMQNDIALAAANAADKVLKLDEEKAKIMSGQTEDPQQEQIEIQKQDLALRAKKQMDIVKMHKDKMDLEETKLIVDDENKHGIFYKHNIRSKIARLNYNLASEIWVVHKSLIKGCDKAASKFNVISGVENFIQNKPLKIKEINTGYDSRFWRLWKWRSNLNS